MFIFLVLCLCCISTFLKDAIYSYNDFVLKINENITFEIFHPVDFLTTLKLHPHFQLIKEIEERKDCLGKY